MTAEMEAPAFKMPVAVKVMLAGAAAVIAIAGIVAFGSGGDDAGSFEDQAKQAISAECGIPEADLEMSYRYVDTNGGGNLHIQTFSAPGHPGKPSVTIGSPGGDEWPSIVSCR